MSTDWAEISVLVSLFGVAVSIWIYFAARSRTAHVSLAILLAGVSLSIALLGLHVIDRTAVKRQTTPPVVVDLPQPKAKSNDSKTGRPSSMSLEPAQPKVNQAFSKQSPFVNQGTFNDSVPAVLVVEEDAVLGQINGDLAAAVGGNDALFTPQFVASGRFERARSGDPTALIDIGLTHAASIIFLGRLQSRSNSDTVAGHTVYKSTIELTGRVYQPATGFSSHSIVEMSSAAGFTDTDARRAAEAALTKRLAVKLGSSLGSR